MFNTRPAPDQGDAPEPLDHGGDLAAVRARFPQACEPWIDLSTGINPHAYPFGALPEACFAHLPEPARLHALEAAAARAYGVADADCVVAAPGAQALIQLLPRLLPGRDVGVLGPTYAEHEANWRRAQRNAVQCASLDALSTCDIGVIVNPNNPTGRIVARGDVLALARRIRLVVDESFADFSPETSIASAAAEGGAVVLRSFGKAYGLAGVRLGFAIAPLTIARALRVELGPWSVSGPAIEIGLRALADTAWLRAEHARLADRAARLDALLLRADFTIAGGTPLFRLVAHDSAHDIADRLGAAGIHVRRFAYRPDWLRFGIPHDAEWARLEHALLTRKAAP